MWAQGRWRLLKTISQSDWYPQYQYAAASLKLYMSLWSLWCWIKTCCTRKQLSWRNIDTVGALISSKGFRFEWIWRCPSVHMETESNRDEKEGFFIDLIIIDKTWYYSKGLYSSFSSSCVPSDTFTALHRSQCKWGQMCFSSWQTFRRRKRKELPHTK